MQLKIVELFCLRTQGNNHSTNPLDPFVNTCQQNYASIASHDIPAMIAQYNQHVGHMMWRTPITANLSHINIFTATVALQSEAGYVQCLYHLYYCRMGKRGGLRASS